MKKIILLLIIFISYSCKDKMCCFDELDRSPNEKRYVYDRFNRLSYYDSCKNGKRCTGAGVVGFTYNYYFGLSSGDSVNYGVCAGDNAECFFNNYSKMWRTSMNFVKSIVNVKKENIYFTW